MLPSSAAVSTLSSTHVTATKAGASEFPSATPRVVTALDIGERIIFVAIFSRFAFATTQTLLAVPNIETFLMLVSEALPCALIVFRKSPKALSTQPADWLFGLAGSVAPLLIKPAAVGNFVPQVVCLTLILAGLFTQIAAKIVLGRSFGVVAANRGVKRAGPYRFVRHPMYAGYTISHIGLLLAMPSLLNATLYVLAFTFQVIRILREEAVLMQSREYQDFAAQVRYRLLPGVF